MVEHTRRARGRGDVRAAERKSSKYATTREQRRGRWWSGDYRVSEFGKSEFVDAVIMYKVKGRRNSSSVSFAQVVGWGRSG